MKRGRWLAVVLFASLAGCASSTAIDRRYLAAYAAAERAGRTFAPVTDTRPQLDLSGAYRVQRRLIAQRVAAGDRVAGYRGGLMSRASLRARGVSQPLVGALFRSGQLFDNAVVPLCGYRRAAVELKLGFVFAHRVNVMPTDLTKLRAAIVEVVPVVDLPDIAYRDPDAYSAVDMVAANISAARYVRGARRAYASIDLDRLEVAVGRDGLVVAAGRGQDSFDDLWASVAMVVGRVLATGRRIVPGDMVLTGRIGERGWLTAGRYRADYGALGTVAFTVEACDR